MTNGDSKLIDNVFNLKSNINLKKLFNINLFLETSNNNLFNKSNKKYSIFNRKCWKFN